MSEFVFKEGVLLSELNPDEVPWSGDVPDVGRVLPTGKEVAVCYHRLVFGAEDDADRALVRVWHQVDDLGGLAPLWAGEARGKVFLHAGAEAPAGVSGTDDDELSCTPVACFGVDGSAQQWVAGVPQLPYHVVPMVAREGVLRNAAGAWRRLSWDPVGVFDVTHGERVIDYEDSLADFTRYTLWCVVAGSYVCFYTTRVTRGSELLEAGAAARWPFSQWLRQLRANHGYDVSEVVYGETSEYEDGGADLELVSGAARLAPLPWQVEGGGELEAEDAAEAAGLVEGQAYAVAPVSVVPRYVVGAMYSGSWNWEIYLMLVDEYLKDSTMGEYVALDEATVRRVLLEDGLCAIATEHYSVDPVLQELLGRLFLDGAQQGGQSWTNPNVFRVVFSLALPENGVTRWPHLLGVAMAHTPSGLTVAGSACVLYNGWEGGSGSGGSGDMEESEGDDEEDEDDYIPPTDDDDEEDEDVPNDPDNPVSVRVGYERGEGFSACSLVRKGGKYYWKLVLDASYVKEALKDVEVPATVTLKGNGSQGGVHATVEMGLGSTSATAADSAVTGSAGLVFHGSNQVDASKKSETYEVTYRLDVNATIAAKTWYLSVSAESSAGTWVKKTMSGGRSVFGVNAQVWYMWSVDKAALRNAALNELQKRLQRRTLSDTDTSTSADSTVTGTLSGTPLAVVAEATLS